MDKFEKILDMIDHQDKYSDEEIRELLQDEECRKLYQTMQEVDSALLEGDLQAQVSNDKSSDSQALPMVDIDEEWEKFEHAHASKLHAKKSSWRKIAAAIAGLVLISGITFAAIHTYIKKSQEPMLITTASHTEAVAQDSVKQQVVKDSLTQVKAAKPAIHKTFENVAFDKMIAEIAAYYDMQVKFDNAEAKSFRLYYEWDSHSSIESIVKDLNQFENVSIELEGQTIVIK